MYSNLSNYGRHVLGPQPSILPSPSARSSVYPFWTPNQAPVPLSRHQSVPALPRSTEIKELKAQLKDLERQVAAKEAAKKARAVAGQMNTLMALMGEPKKPDQDVRYQHMLQTMQEQQRTISEMVQTLQQLPPPQPPVVVYPQYPSPERPRQDHVRSQYETMKRDPKMYDRLMGEMDEDELNMRESASRIPSFHPSPSHSSRPRPSPVVPRSPSVPEQPTPADDPKPPKAEMVSIMNTIIDAAYSNAKVWIIKAIRAPLTSVLNDPELDLNVVSQSQSLKQGQGKPDQINTKILTDFGSLRRRRTCRISCVCRCRH